MSQVHASRVELIKKVLKELHEGRSLEELKEKYSDLLPQISSLEIVMVEQELVKEGIPITDILNLCDLHVELFRKALSTRELSNIPRGHPLDLLIRENELLLKHADALGLYSSLIASALSRGSINEALNSLSNAVNLLNALRGEIRLHYRKNQMIIFPYLERRGIIAIPRVMWGREDQVIVKARELSRELEEGVKGELIAEKLKTVLNSMQQLAGEITDLVFRENKILYPATWALFSEGEWAAIAEVAREIGYVIEVSEEKWKPSEKPVLPFEVSESIPPEKIPLLPEEFRAIALLSKIDSYNVKKPSDLELETGFLTPEEVEGIFRSLPIEVTYADSNNRIRFYSESEISGGFARAKTILGRRLEYCHPPRLEQYVSRVVEQVKKGVEKHRVFWTKLGDRVIRVIVASVKNSEGELLGVLEIVEDLTEVVNNPEEVKKRIVVL
ncbi:MAG: DUF438 domain-containing protein [Sulfolobales archaeon]|nr:DUF438 domain-containing protein [Sulfolobales archaeon]